MQTRVSATALGRASARQQRTAKEECLTIWQFWTDKRRQHRAVLDRCSGRRQRTLLVVTLGTWAHLGLSARRSRMLLDNALRRHARLRLRIEYANWNRAVSDAKAERFHRQDEMAGERYNPFSFARARELALFAGFRIAG